MTSGFDASRRRWRPAALSLALVTAVSVGACNQAPRSHASAAATAACRQRADEIYQRQNRGELYRTDTFVSSNRDSPFASSGLPGITTAGLGGIFQRDQFQSDCLASSGQGAAIGGSATPSGDAATGATKVPGP